MRIQMSHKLFFLVEQQPNSGLDPLIVEVSRLHTIRHIHTLGRTPLNEWSARCRGRYLHNTQHTQEKNIFAFSRIRTRDPRNQAASGLRRRPHGHRDRHTRLCCTLIWQRWLPCILARVHSTFRNIFLNFLLGLRLEKGANGHIFKYKTY